MHFWKTKALTYLSGAYAYRWYAVIVAWVVCMIGWAGIAAMPDQYKANAKVYIDADNLMDPLLKGLTVSLDQTQEISVMLKTLITRPTLEQVIHLTMPNANKLTAGQMEEEVQRLQNNIAVSLLETKNYYEISYIDKDASTAASVAQALLSILQNNKVGNTRLNMDDARSFINKKVAEYENRLREADKRRADFKTANIDILGGGNAGNRIDVANTAYDQATKDYNSAVARRDSVKAQLESTPREISADQRMFLGAMSGPIMAAAAPVAARPTDNSLQRLQQAQGTLDDLRAKYTDSHPDVVAARKLVDQLRAQSANQTAAAPKEKAADAAPVIERVMIPNPAYVQLQAKYSDEEAAVAVARQHLSAATADLEKSKAQASRAVDVQTKFQELDRDYGNVEATYRQLLTSRESANLSQARDDENEGITFRVLEAPQKPQSPAAPNRTLLNTVVLIAGIGAGIAAAVLLTFNAARLITTDDVASLFAIPIIGVVTRLPDPIAGLRGRLPTLVLGAAVACLVVVYAGVLVVFSTSIHSMSPTALLAPIKALVGAGHG